MIQNIRDPMTLNFVLGVVSLAGVLFTIYYGRKASLLEKAKKTLSWPDLQVICDSIALSLKRDKFIPEVILCPGLRGGILAELLINKFERNIPIFVGISYRDFSKTKKLQLEGYKEFRIADDWDILIPDTVFGFTERRLLIVDDFCLTGEFFQQLKKYVIENGFSDRKVKVFSSVITTVTKSSGRQPDYYSVVTDDDYFYFPWGKANMG